MRDVHPRGRFDHQAPNLWNLYYSLPRGVFFTAQQFLPWDWGSQNHLAIPNRRARSCRDAALRGPFFVPVL